MHKTRIPMSVHFLAYIHTIIPLDMFLNLTFQGVLSVTLLLIRPGIVQGARVETIRIKEWLKCQLKSTFRVSI